MQTLTVRAEGEPFPVHLAVPEGPGPWPGVVVIHDIFGVTTDLHRQAEWLAAAGFLAAAPDLYSRGNHLGCIYRTIRQVRSRQGTIFNQIEAARHALVRRSDCTGAVGVIGFCIGGDFALLLSPTGLFRVSSVNYGAVPEDAESLLAQSCPIVASYGAKDHRLAGAARRLTSALAAAGIDHDVKEYPDAGHAFMNTAGRTITAVGRLGGAGHNPASEFDARGRIIEFFDRELRSGHESNGGR